MSLSQAVRFGHMHVAHIGSQQRALYEWSPLCDGTAMLVAPMTYRPEEHPGLPRVHLVSCGHVVQPQGFYELYGERASGRLSSMKDADIRVSVSIPDDTGNPLFTCTAKRQLFATSSVADDTAVAHLTYENESDLFDTLHRHYGSSSLARLTPNKYSTVHPSGELEADFSFSLEAIQMDQMVCMPTYTLLKSQDLEKEEITANMLYADYEGVLGDLNERRGVQDDLELAGRKMVPMIHHGVLVEENQMHTAALLKPGIISANSGSPLLRRRNEETEILGMLYRYINVVGARESVANPVDNRQSAVSDRLGQGVCAFIPAWKLCNFVQKIEKHLLQTVGKC